MKHLDLILFLLLFLFSSPMQGRQNDISQQQSFLLKGRVIASDTKDVLANASVTLEGGSISSITNMDGYFRLIVPSSSANSNIIIRYLGYENLKVPVKDLIDKSDIDIVLLPSSISLNELYVVSGDGLDIVREAFRLVPKNYSSDPNMMVAFYRETIKKNSNYISLVEAVLDIYKSSYAKYGDDQAKIYIGRKASDVSPRDTVIMKFQGGISTALNLDMAKHPEIVFSDNYEQYSFNIEGIININDKPHYVIKFEPHPYITDILYRGTMYIDVESKAISRVEFNMNVEDRKDASAIFIIKKPSKMRVEVLEARYVVNYIERNGNWYFDYSGTNVTFRVRWTNRLFGLIRTTYAIGAEMSVTDRYDSEINKFPRKERIRSSDVIAEKVEHFQDPHFWGDYNVIEPDIEISKAIKRLSGKLLRREQ